MIQDLKDKKLREELVLVARRINSIGLNQGTSGNLSVRISDGILITPSSLPFEEMEPNDLVALDLLGNHLWKGQLQPSSEWRLHTDILRKRADIGAIVHCHSVHATAVSCQEKAIPSFHYMTAVAGGNDIRCATYATFGTKEFSGFALDALEGRLACLLAHHGQMALGENLKIAFQIAVEVETLSNMYLKASLLGDPPLLTSEQMIEVHNQFKSINYGKKAI